MSYSILLIFLALMTAPMIANHSPNIISIVGFSDGAYVPELIEQLGGKIVLELKSLRMVHAEIPASQLSTLAADPSVKFVETDSSFSMVSSVESAEYTQSWGIADIGAEQAYASGHTGKGVRIAVLDTGIDYDHHDLAPNYKGGYDFINDDDDPMDDNGHGTHVAGIIAAASDGEGVAGVAPEADIYAVKVSDNRGKGSFSGLAKGINWAIENDMDIVTMSITGTGGTVSLKTAIETAYHDYGILLLAAVGNGGSGEVLYPAAYEEVIGVGSVSEDRLKSSFSRTGDEVELVAPGSGIISDAIGGGLRTSSGTSMATPFVTGSAALLLESDEAAWTNHTAGAVDGDGEWTNDEVRAVLRASAVDLGEEGVDEDYGHGLLSMRFPGEDQSDSIMPVPGTLDDGITLTIDRESVWVRFVFSLI